MFVCVYHVCLCFILYILYVLYYCERGGVDILGLKPNPYDLSSFGALTLLVGSFDP